MKKLMMAMMLMPLMALADTETVDGITWTYKIIDGKAQVGTGSSSSRAISAGTVGAITIPSTLGGCPVTSIGAYAFYYCSGLTSVTIPEGVTSIGAYAFYDCRGLAAVKISDLSAWCRITFADSSSNPVSYGHKLYLKNEELTDLLLPEDITEIRDYAFDGCSGLKEVAIHEDVTYIGDYAFRNCSGVTSMTIPEGVRYIGDYAFGGCAGLTDSEGFVVVDGVLYDYVYDQSYSVEIPSRVTRIGCRAFSGCWRLRSITIPSSVASIGDRAFESCGLESITIPSSVTKIGDYAFRYCNSLSSVRIPSSVTSIGDCAFWNCSGLTSVTIPLSVKRIGQSAFDGTPFYENQPNGMVILGDGVLYEFKGPCPSTVMIPKEVKCIGDYAFSGCSELMSVTIPEGVTRIGRMAFYGCSGLKSVAIPSSMRNIGYGAFDGTSFYENQPDGLVILEGGMLYGVKGSCPESVTIPPNVTCIGDYAFSGCEGLTSVSIPPSVTRIGDYAFYGCRGLTSMTIPEGVAHVGDYAFADCNGLMSVAIPLSVANIGNRAFDNCSGLGNGVVIIDGCVLSVNGTCPDSVVLPQDVRLIAGGAFYGCYGLTTVVIPSTVTRIGDYAFCGCHRMKSVTISEGVTSIGSAAFCGCREVLFMTIPSTVMSLGHGVFSECANLTLTFDGACPDNYIRSGVVGIKKSIFPDNYKFTYPTVQDALDEFGISVSGYVRGLDVYDRCNNGYFRQFTGYVWFESRGESWNEWTTCPAGIKLGADGVPFGSETITFDRYDGTQFTAIAAYGASLDLCSDVFVTTENGACIGITSVDYAVLSEKGEGEPYKMGECVALRRNNNYGVYCQVSVGSDGSSYSGDYGIFHNGVYYYKIPSADNADAWYWYHGQDDLYKFKTWFLYVDCGTGGTAYTLVVEPTCKSYCIEFDVSSRAPYGAAFRQLTVGMVSDPHTDDWYSIDLDMSDCTELPYEIEDHEWWVLESNDWGDVYETCETVPTRHYEAGFAVDLGWRFVGWKLEDGIVRNADGNLLRTGDVVESVQDMVAESSAKFVAVYAPIMYGIAFEDVKGCENANTNAYTVEDEVVFLPLSDLPDWHFDGWSPASIPVGSTGDVTVVAQWRPIETAEIVGAWSEPRTFEYDGRTHGVDYSARLDVMEWPLNVVTQGTIRAVNVGEYAATATAETVGVPETDAVYYRCAAVTNECKWTITPKPVTKLQIIYVSTAMIANGQQQKPQIVVRDVERGVVLTIADYALAYENNVEPGMGIARITGKGNYGGETVIEFPIVAGVSPSAGLNMGDGTFEIVGETDWVADNVVTHDGYASMRSGAIGDNETSALTAVVHGAGTVSFWWKVSSQHFDGVLELDRLEFYVDGVRQKWVNGDVDWTKLSFKVNGAGPHELKWVYAKDGSTSERQDCGWVDEVSWEKEWLIGDWLNDVDREFATSNVKWTPDATVSSDVVGSMRSGACLQGQRSTLSTAVENVGTLTFKWKSSCVAYGEYVTDKLSLLVDGVAVKDADGKDIFINGQTGWRDVSYRITGAGRHEVQWVFEKVSDASMGQNCGWVDVVRWDNEPGTLTDEDLVVNAFDGVYDGQGHGAAVSVKGVQDASVKYGTSRETIGDAASPMFANCGEYEVWFAVNLPDFNEYVGKAVIRIRPRSIEAGEVTLGAPLVYTGLDLTQDVASVVVDGLEATFEVSDNAARAAGAYQLTVAGTGNFCGELSVPFTVARAQAPSGDVTVEGYSPDAGAVEFTYDGKSHVPTVVAGYDGAAVVRFALTEEGPYADELNVSNAVERMDIWYEIVSANYERLVGRTQMTIRPLSVAGAEVVLGEQVSDVEGHVVQLVDSVIVNGLSATFAVSNNVATAEGDFELCVYGTGNFAGMAKCPYSVGGVVLPPLLTPGDGTIFSESQVVRFTAQTPDSKWYYTLDGSMPTTNSLKASRVNLHGKTTIRAIAVLDGKLRSAVVEAHYALGACENPTVRLDGQDGRVFHFPGQLVVIDRNGEEGVVRYTLDGSEPTATSPAYEGPFAISASTTVKAKTFSDTWFDSETVTADMRLEVLSVPLPVVQAASEYKGTRTTVSMSCALEGSVIRYTLDGSEPTQASAQYESPFEIGGDIGAAIHVKARAFRDSYEDSPVAEIVVTRIWGIGDTLGVPDLMFTTDGWVVDRQETFGGRETMRSGPTDDGETDTLETVVHGGGVVAFTWRTSCEDSGGDFIWDRAEFWVDDACVANREGETSWDLVEYEIPDDGADHVLRWLYVKDPDLDTAEGEDCAWLAALSWERKDVFSVIVVEDPNGKIVLPGGKDITEVEVKVMCNGSDIFPYLNLPAAVNGVIDLSLATLKDEIAKEPLDTTKGAKIELSSDNPKITTAPTKPGLTYTLREGETLGGMKNGDSKVGDGQPWSPEITVKGGNSAFYSIGVGKGK